MESIVAENLVVDEIGPGGRGTEQTLALPIDLAGRDPDAFESLDNALFDPFLEDCKRGSSRPAELGEGVPPVELDEVDLVAQGLHVGEMLAPAAVEGDQGDAPLDGAQDGLVMGVEELSPPRALLRQQALVSALQDLLPPLLQHRPLALEHPGSGEQPFAEVRILPFGDALDPRHLALRHWMTGRGLLEEARRQQPLNAVALHEIVFEAGEESGLTGSP